jgi:hypothetical protein
MEKRSLRKNEKGNFGKLVETLPDNFAPTLVFKTILYILLGVTTLFVLRKFY